MYEKPKRGTQARSDSIIGAIIGAALIFGVIAFVSQNSLICGCFGFPGTLIVIVIVVLMLLASSRSRSNDDVEPPNSQ